MVYSNHFNNPFAFDDFNQVVDNIYVRHLKNIPSFFKDASTSSSLPSHQTYRPVVMTTLAIDYYLGGGLNPFYFHLSTFVWFLVQLAMMFFFFSKIFKNITSHPWADYIAVFAVAWYGLHTANAETINYIYQRGDALSTLCVVCAFYIFVAYPNKRSWCLYVIPLVIGVFTKEPAIMFAPILFIYVVLFESKNSLYDIFSRNGLEVVKKALFKTLPAFIVCGGVGLFVVKMQASTWESGGNSKFYYLITQPWVLLRYFFTFFIPANLSADTDWEAFTNVFDERLFAGLVFMVLMIIIAFRASRQEKTRPVAFGIIWFFIALLPTSSFVALAEVTNDHRMFFPFVGLTCSTSWAIGLFIIKHYKRINENFLLKCILLVFCLALLGAYAYGTRQRNIVWQSNESLWYDVTLKSPKNGRGLMNYGLALMAKGDYNGAEKYFLKALERTPNYATLHINLGVLNEATGKNKQAEAYFKKAISLLPRDPEGYYYYGRFLNKQKLYAEAAANLEATLRLSSAHLNAHSLLVPVYLELGDVQKAAEAAAKILRIAGTADKRALMLQKAIKRGKSKEEIIAGTKFDVDTPQYFMQLSLSYYLSGNFEKSITAAQKALQLRPGYDLAYNNICAAYSELKQWDKAIEAGEEAVKLNPDNQLARNNLVWAKKGKTDAYKTSNTHSK